MSLLHHLPVKSVGGPLEHVIPHDFNGIMIVGEAPGEREIELQTPFVGKSGKLLNDQLSAAGIDRSQTLVVNAFRHRPEKNKIGHFFVSTKRSKAEGICIDDELGALNGNFCIAEHATDVRRLEGIIKDYRPKVAISLGGTATWAMTGKVGISELVGMIAPARWKPAIPVVPTWHPAYLLRRNNKELEMEFNLHLRKAKKIADIVQ